MQMQVLQNRNGNILEVPKPTCKEQQSSFREDSFFDLMKYERLRFITYFLYGHQWPKIETISPTLLAKAGFFYLKNDAVQCAFCRGIVQDWDDGNIPMEEHKRHFPTCPFVNEKFVANVPIELDPEINKANHYVDEEPGPEPIKVKYNTGFLPKYPAFRDPKIRAKTFENWSFPIDKQLFIDAGFYHLGKKDYTRCYHCGGMLLNWKKDEIPLEEHALFFPECAFIISLKGENYLEFVQFKREIIKMRSKMDTSNQSKTRDINSMRKLTYENFLKLKQCSSRLISQLEESITSKTTQGYYKEYLDKFYFFLDCQKLYQYFCMMNMMRRPSLDYNSDDSESGASSTNSSIFSLSCSSSDTSSANDSDFSISNSDSEDNGNNLTMIEKKQPNNKPSSLKCIICCEKQIEVVFLPCGHQLACMKCAEKIDDCPICRIHIENKVRTYFAYFD